MVADEIAKMVAGQTASAPISPIWGTLDLAMKWSFQEVASIIHKANTTQRVENDGVNQPLSVVVVHNMWRVGDIETHYNHLSDEYVTGPQWQSQVPRFAVYAVYNNGQTSSAVLLANGYNDDFTAVMNAIIGN